MTFQIQQVLIDQPRCTKRAVPAYLLASDGTNSAVWHTPNLALSSPVWTKGAEISAIYTQLRITKTAGTIMALTDHATVVNWTHVFDFTIDEQGWSLSSDPIFGCQVGGVYAGSGGWEGTVSTTCPPNWSAINVVSPTFSNSQKITYFSIYHCNGYDAGSHHNCYWWFDATRSGYISENSNCYFDENFNTYEDVTSMNVVLSASFPVVDSSWHLYSVSMHGTGVNPFASPVTGTVRVSSDYGLTFGSGIDTVDNPKGFDVQLAGEVSYVGGKDAVYSAATLGGAYSSYHTFTGSNVVALNIPTHRVNSRTQKQTTVSNPDVYVALDSPYFTGTLFYINGVSGVAFNITPIAGMTFDNAHCIWSYYGTVIEVWGKVGGIYKLYRTIDAGTTWVLIDTVTNPKFITGRRGDTRAAKGGVAGQIYLVENDAISYSSKLASNWTVGGTHFPRTLPSTGVKGADVLG